jgi:hypothetical protein
MPIFLIIGLGAFGAIAILIATRIRWSGASSKRKHALTKSAKKE